MFVVQTPGLLETVYHLQLTVLGGSWVMFITPADHIGRKLGHMKETDPCQLSRVECRRLDNLICSQSCKA